MQIINGQTVEITNILYKKEFGGMQSGMKGVVDLECPILLNEDALEFIQAY
jgi:hypothetical protein